MIKHDVTLENFQIKELRSLILAINIEVQIRFQNRHSEYFNRQAFESMSKQLASALHMLSMMEHE